MALEILKRGHKPLVMGPNQGQAAEAKPFKMSWFSRKHGAASFLDDLRALRKTLALCYHCANHKLPRRWRTRWDYEELTIFHGENDCDYCLRHESVSLFLPGEEPYWQEYEAARRTVDAVRQRERALLMKDRRFMLGA